METEFLLIKCFIARAKCTMKKPGIHHAHRKCEAGATALFLGGIGNPTRHTPPRIGNKWNELTDRTDVRA